jgi:hypothetical protein
MATFASAHKLRLILICSMAIVYIMVPGCGRKEPPTGKVSGSVTYKGNPLPEGLIKFINDQEGREGSAGIKDGAYVCPNAPVGECGIEVVVNKLQAGPGPSKQFIDRLNAKRQKAREMGVQTGDDLTDIPKPEKSKAVPIPRKYANTRTSGLSLKVAEGQQTYDVELQP